MGFAIMTRITSLKKPEPGEIDLPASERTMHKSNWLFFFAVSAFCMLII